MDYTDRYNETERIDLGDGFWIDVKKTLTGAEKKRAEKVRVQYSVERQPNGDVRQVVSGFDVPGYDTEMAILSIVDWNLPGGDDQDPSRKWELNETRKRAYYGLLSPEHQALIEGTVSAFNATPTREEDAQFPVDGEGELHDEEDQTPDADQVLGRAEVLAAVGDSPGPPAA
jgi:hypothetical protein